MTEWRSSIFLVLSSTRAHVLAAVLLLAFGLAGCARLIASYDVAPNGLTRTDNELRRYLALGRADSALIRLAKPNKKAQLPKDELLRVLYEGVTAHYAGDYARSTAAFDRADAIADDRSTKSLSKAALSVMVNDLSLAWEPSRTERLLIPYYGALSFLRAGNYEDAAVEARRLSYLLQTLEDDGKAPDKELHAFLRNFAGIVFEAAGHYNDADVAYRNAVALDSFRYQKPARNDSAGEVIVLIEHGFAPYRVQESLVVVIGDDESHEFEDDDEDHRRESALKVAARVLQYANSSGPRVGEPRSRTLRVPAPPQPKASGESRHHRRTENCDSNCSEKDDDEDHSYMLRMSWPVMYDFDRHIPSFHVLVDSTAIGETLRADVARSVLDDFQREQPAIIARAIARAVAKYAMTKGLEKKAGKSDESLGRLAGVLANIGGAITEQADTRSWHFVPRSISVVRYAVPAGTHAVKVDSGNGNAIELGTINLKAGQIAVFNTRVWN